MTERLTPNGTNTNINNVPIHEMPDFQAALDDYRKVLKEIDVPLADIERVTNEIQSKPTRRQGNKFINLVHVIGRGNKPKAF